MIKLLCFQFQFYENIYIVIQLLHTFNSSFTHLAFMRKLPSFTEFASLADLGIDMGGGGRRLGVAHFFKLYTPELALICCSVDRGACSTGNFEMTFSITYYGRTMFVFLFLERSTERGRRLRPSLGSASVHKYEMQMCTCIYCNGDISLLYMSGWQSPTRMVSNMNAMFSCILYACGVGPYSCA